MRTGGRVRARAGPEWRAGARHLLIARARPRERTPIPIKCDAAISHSETRR
jgi:hypothetical protein